MAIYKPRTETSEGTKPINSLISSSKEEDRSIDSAQSHVNLLTKLENPSNSAPSCL
jgi:hypothetical protein